jgi:hypothetical protein
LDLSGDRFERDAEFGSEIEGPEGYFAIEFPQFGQSAIGASDGFAFRAFHGVAEDAPGPEEERHGVEIAAELLLAEFGDLFGERVEME